MLNRTDLQQLADIRIAEASALLGLATPMSDGAYYLAGYAVECALKAFIAGRYNQHDWPEKEFVNKCHTHELGRLMQLAGLDAAMEAETAGNPDLAANWSIVKDWSERSRYERHSAEKATKLIDAVTDKNGVLPWIKARW